VPPDFQGVEVLTAELVTRAHDEGRAVWVWASDRSQENVDTYRAWLALGVDGILAGRPADMTAARS
jgi:glycerophosphoryl diester phosphodiesterase